MLCEAPDPGTHTKVHNVCLNTCLMKSLLHYFQVGRYELETNKMFDFTRSKVRESVERSLKMLQVDQIDLLQVGSQIFHIIINLIHLMIWFSLFSDPRR